MAFVTPLSTSAFTAVSKPTSALSSRRTTTLVPSKRSLINNKNNNNIRMGVGEDGLADDLAFAQSCIDDGCSIDAVQDVLTRLERRRAVLTLEVEKIEEVMGILAKENLGGDRSLIADAMAAAVSIFSKTNDDYPGVGDNVNAWTLDPLKKQPKL